MAVRIRPGGVIDQVALEQDPNYNRRGGMPPTAGKGRTIQVTQLDPLIPNVDWSNPPVTMLPSNSSESAAPKPSNIELPGPTTVLPLIYGKRLRQPFLDFVQIRDQCLIVRLLWGMGPISGIDEFTMTPLGDMWTGGSYTWTEWTSDTDPMPFRYYSGGGEILYKHYLGSATQGIDPTMVVSAAYWAQTYVDALPYVAYTIVQIPLDAMEYWYSTTSHPFPTFTGVVRGMKVRQHTGGSPGTWIEDYSDVPAYCLADFITNTRYGAGMDVDYDEVLDLADENTEVIVDGNLTEQRRVLNVAFDSPQTVDTIIESLRGYAGAIVYTEGEQMRIVRDKPDPLEDQIILNADNVLEGSIKLRKRGIRNTPTLVRVDYCANFRSSSTDANETAFCDGLAEGRIDRRMQSLSRPGTTSAGEAHRLAVRYLNDAILCDMTLTCRVRDEGLRIRVGKLVRFAAPPYTSAAELEDAKWRIIQAKQYSPGRWDLVLQTFDWRLFSDAIVENPYLEGSPGEGGGGSGGGSETVPDVTWLLLAYELYDAGGGVMLPRLLVNWDPSDYALLDHYQLTIRQEVGLTTSVITSADVVNTTFTTGAVAPSTHYVATVKVVSTSGLTSAGRSYELQLGDVSTAPYDVACTYNGKPKADIDVLRFPFVRTVSFPSGLTGSYGNVVTAPAAQTDFTIKKNGGSIGTMRFAAGQTAATFIFNSTVAFAAGDVMQVTAPHTPDTTLADLGFCLRGYR